MPPPLEACLSAVAWCLLAAYASCMPQLPALVGNRGLLVAPSGSITEWAKYLEISVDSVLTSVSCLGMLAALVSLIVRQRLLRGICFLLATVLYQRFVDAGSTFLSFQWDILIVEAGFACALASFVPSIGSVVIRFALAKLMLQSGAVKLQAGCPTWEGLTAAQVHFASQCIPTPVAWLLHNLPSSFQSWSIALTLWIEGPAVPLLLLTPFPAAMALGAWLQIALQVIILISGNYNFFNILTAALAFACLPSRPPPVSQEKSRCSRQGLFAPVHVVHALCHTTPLLVLQWVALVVACLLSWAWMFDMRWNGPAVAAKALPWWHLYDVTLSHTVAKPAALSTVLQWTLPTLVAWTWVQFMLAALESIVGGLSDDGVEVPKPASGCRSCLSACMLPLRVMWRFAAGAAGVLLFGASATNLLALEPKTLKPEAILPLPAMAHSTLMQSYHLVKDWKATHSYGLFRRMTGTGSTRKDAWGYTLVDTARPELVLEAQWGDERSPWYELEFPYKPGHPSRSPPWVLPHQPRLDWQMWFAALGDNIGDSPWLLSLVRALLEGEPSAYALMDTSSWPMTAVVNRTVTGVDGKAHTASEVLYIAPTAIRVGKWTYDFTMPANKTAWPWVDRRFKETKKDNKPSIPSVPYQRHPIARAVQDLLPVAWRVTQDEQGEAAEAAEPAGPWWRRKKQADFYLPEVIQGDSRLPDLFQRMSLPSTLIVDTVKVAGQVKVDNARREVTLDTRAELDVRGIVSKAEERAFSLDTSSCDGKVAGVRKRWGRIRAAVHATVKAAFEVSAYKVYQNAMHNPTAAAEGVVDAWSATGESLSRQLQPVAAAAACVVTQGAESLGYIHSPAYGRTLETAGTAGAPGQRLVYLQRSAHVSQAWLLVALAAITVLLRVARACGASCTAAWPCCCRGSRNQDSRESTAAPIPPAEARKRAAAAVAGRSKAGGKVKTQ